MEILNLLEKRISEKDFQNQLIKAQKIDFNHFTKKITIEELKKYIDQYKNKNYIENNLKNLQILLPGNPEIVFQICLEVLKLKVNATICIEEFCLAQNTIIIELANQIMEECKIKNKIKLKNLVKDEDIVKESSEVDKTICIGDSNLYNRLLEKIDNFIFYPYGILEMYLSSEEFDELGKTIYEYAMQNQFEIEIYDDLEIEEAIKAINRDGYQFCSLLLSKDEKEIELFKKEIKSKCVVINENPFKKMKFDFKLL